MCPGEEPSKNAPHGPRPLDAPRLVMQSVLLDLHEHFADLDDSGDGPFGEYARVYSDSNVVTVLHETEGWGIRFTAEPIEAEPLDD